jgi:processive 1,2-diacylglycerol beta-glucosyltransferase
MAVKAVLILTAGFGEGHNAAARNLAEGLRAADPQLRVEVHDVFLEAYGWMNRLVQRGYLAVINHAPALWSLIFALLDRIPIGRGIGIFGRAVRHLSAMLRTFQPDVVVSTYPGNGYLLDLLHRDGVRPFRTITIVTDSLTINTVWHRCHSDYFLVPNDATAAVMREAGVPDDKIRTTGFPVPLLFSDPSTAREVPPAGSRWQVLYMVNSSHHLAPEIVRAILPLADVALTVTVGRDNVLAGRLEALSKETGCPLEIHGWTPEIPHLIRRSHLLISKAGGATVQEALAARTPMVVTQIVPGQEEGNARLLIESGAGELATSAAAIAAAVRRTFAGDAAVFRQRFEATGALSHPDAARAAARFILSCDPPSAAG